MVVYVAGCFYSTALGGLRSFENPKNKITAIPAKEEEIWGATFKVIDWFSKNISYLVFIFFPVTFLTKLITQTMVVEHRWKEQQFLQTEKENSNSKKK